MFTNLDAIVELTFVGIAILILTLFLVGVAGFAFAGMLKACEAMFSLARTARRGRS